MAVAMTSDYSGASFTKLALFKCLEMILKLNSQLSTRDFDDFHDNRLGYLALVL